MRATLATSLALCLVDTKQRNSDSRKTREEEEPEGLVGRKVNLGISSPSLE